MVKASKLVSCPIKARGSAKFPILSPSKSQSEEKQRLQLRHLGSNFRQVSQLVSQIVRLVSRFIPEGIYLVWSEGIWYIYTKVLKEYIGQGVGYQGSIQRVYGVQNCLICYSIFVSSLLDQSSSNFVKNSIMNLRLASSFFQFVFITVIFFHLSTSYIQLVAEPQ